jgi:hypothetical protein
MVKAADCGSFLCREEFKEVVPMPKAPRQLRPQPVIYWRLVGVAMGMAALVIITLIFALKTWAESRRSSAPAPGMRNQLVLPNAEPKPETKPVPTIIESPRMKDEEKKEAAIDARKPSALAAAVENYAPSGFN